MRIEQIDEPIAAPRVIWNGSRLTALAGELARSGYSTQNLARRLGVFPRLGVNFWRAMRPRWTPNANDSVDTLLELLIDGQLVEASRVERILSADAVSELLETGLAERDGTALVSRLCLFPCYGRYVATDRAAKNTAINQVMWLWGESFLLGGLVGRAPRRRALDLGTGSGVHAILASGHCDSVMGVDISPRALEFARFNAALNGVENAEFVRGDLWDALTGTFDLVVANPPYLPDTGASPGENFWTGGPVGTDLLGRIVRALPERLDADGAAHVVALYPCRPGETVRDLFTGWLGKAEAWQVLDHTWAVPGFQDALSEKPYAGDKRGWRFGVVSLRRAKGGAGWWKAVGGSGIFFREDGSCKVVADFDAE